jgi:hypothetical protein
MKFIIPARYFIFGAKHPCFPIQNFIQSFFLFHFLNRLMDIGYPDYSAFSVANRTV